VVHAVSSKVTSSPAGSGKAASGKARSGKATSGKAASGKAVLSEVTSVVRRQTITSTASVRTASPVAAPRARARARAVDDDNAVVPRASATRGAALSRVTSALAIPTPAADPGSVAQRVPRLAPHPTTTTTTTLGLTTALAPVAKVTSAVAHAAPAASSLLAPVASLPRTLIHSPLITQTDSTLVHTITGLTHTTTALTAAVGTLGGTATDLSSHVLAGLSVLTGTAVGGGPAASPAVALTQGTSADRFVAAASTRETPALLGGVARAPVPAGVAPAQLTGPGSPSDPWPTLEAAAGPASHRVVPGAPAPGDPAAPAAPAGTAGVTAGPGVSAPAGMLTDPLALPAIMTMLVLIACGWRRTWWFPEVAVGPD
jgi:hypothetical protein